MAKKKDGKAASSAAAGGKNRTMWVVGAVIGVGLLIGLYSMTSRAFGSTAAAPVAVEGLDDPERLYELAQGVLLGDPDAPVTIYEFGDYQCPSCQAFAHQVKPQVDLAYIESGRAKLLFYDFPLVTIHPNAFLAARAARCAGDQDRYWQYHDQLFRNQRSWSGSGSPVGLFVSYAEPAGVDEGAFEGCLKSDRHAEVVTANMRLGEELGVSGTPTIMVSRGQGMATRLGSFAFEAVQQAVDALLEEG